MLGGLAYYHLNGILHGDIRGFNILYGGQRIKLATFGSVKLIHIVTNGDVTNSEFTGTELQSCSLGLKISIQLLMYGQLVDYHEVNWSLFPGENERDQLNKIFEPCGTPHEVNWPGVSKLPRYEDYKPMEQMANRLREVFHHVDYHAFKLPEKLLTVDPSQRISAKDAGRSAYFSLSLIDQQFIPLPGPTQ